jgi:hypothetical protein
MLKIKSIGNGVPDFYTSPYLVRKITAIGNNQDKEVIVEDECKSFLDEDFVNADPKWTAAVALHVIGMAIGVLICLLLILSMLFEWSSNHYRMTGCVWIIICTMFTGMTFIALDSNLCFDNPVIRELDIIELYKTDCEIGSGSIMLIIGVVGLFLTGVMTCFIKGEDVPRKEKAKKQDEDEKDVEDPTTNPEPEPEPVEEQDPDPEPMEDPEAEPVEDPEAGPVEELEPTEEDPQVTEETNEFNNSSKSATGSGMLNKSAVVAD